MKDTLLFSIALNGYDKLFRECIYTQQRYSKKFSFKYCLINKGPQKLTGEESAWLKLYLLREALQCGYEWLGFIDADCEVREHTPDFRTCLSSGTKASIFMANGFSGRINSGVIFMKNTPEAKAYLDEVIKNRENPVPEEDQAPFENGHMIKYGKHNPSVEIINNRLWNNNIEFDPGSYIQHYSGGKLRPLYLKEHTIAKRIYLLRKKWELYTRKYNKTFSRCDLEEQMSWFKNEYSYFQNE